MIHTLLKVETNAQNAECFATHVFLWENLHIQDDNEKAEPSALSDVMKT